MIEFEREDDENEYCLFRVNQDVSITGEQAMVILPQSNEQISFSDLSIEFQNTILHQLYPNGNWRPNVSAIQSFLQSMVEKYGYTNTKSKLFFDFKHLPVDKLWSFQGPVITKTSSSDNNTNKKNKKNKNNNNATVDHVISLQQPTSNQYLDVIHQVNMWKNDQDGGTVRFTLANNNNNNNNSFVLPIVGQPWKLLATGSGCTTERAMENAVEVYLRNSLYNPTVYSLDQLLTFLKRDPQLLETSDTIFYDIIQAIYKELHQIKDFSLDIVTDEKNNGVKKICRKCCIFDDKTKNKEFIIKIIGKWTYQEYKKHIDALF